MELKRPEHDRTVLLIGVRGEVPIMHRSLKSPLIDPVAEGDLAVSYELHRSLGLKSDIEVSFMGETFKIAKRVVHC